MTVKLVEMLKEKYPQSSKRLCHSIICNGVKCIDCPVSKENRQALIRELEASIPKKTKLELWYDGLSDDDKEWLRNQPTSSGYMP
jgi:hypothetical protein